MKTKLVAIFFAGVVSSSAFALNPGAGLGVRVICESNAFHLNETLKGKWSIANAAHGITVGSEFIRSDKIRTVSAPQQIGSGSDANSYPRACLTLTFEL